MADVYFSLERVVRFEASDVTTVPDSIVAQGDEVIRGYLRENIDEYGCDREVMRENLVIRVDQ